MPITSDRKPPMVGLVGVTCSWKQCRLTPTASSMLNVLSEKASGGRAISTGEKLANAYDLDMVVGSNALG
mgnify:CR=1 FL=1